MRHRALTAAVSVFAAITIMAGCGGAGTSPFSKSAKKDVQEQGKTINIALVSCGAGIDDGSFVQDNYNGICDFIKEHHGSTVSPVIEPTGRTEEAVAQVKEIAPRYDVIVCTGYQFAGITETAKANPDTGFILVDAFPVDEAGNVVEADNIYAMMFREEESGFLAGMAAALTTSTGKVAVVNGMAVEANINYQYGFMSGVNYTNRNYGTNTEIVELAKYAGVTEDGKNVGGNYIGSFNDDLTGRNICKALINEGCDVIFAAAGASCKGVLDIIKESEREVYMIASDTDMSREGVVGSRNVILTSAVKYMGKNDTRLLGEYLDGTFGGGNHILGADTGSTGYINLPDRCRLSEDATEKIDKAYELMKSGAIVPASAVNGASPDSFTGIDAV
ncbi:MAG: BMP family ABC transporter substrate-binding protein [Ruminiclostridium sp.]|nr:BMP family ABC transporter substrate-binding protein [Ruminiclostridium sp.]